MRPLCDLSGPWVGFWIQDFVRGSMGLALKFGKGRISGRGADLVGKFSFSGAYSGEGRVTITKKYVWHSVHYKGVWDGQMISGTWSIPQFDAGSFEIWPESDRYELGAMEIEETRELTLT